MATSAHNTSTGKQPSASTGAKADSNADNVSVTFKKDNESILLLLDIVRRQQQLLTGKRTPDYAALGSIIEFVDHYQTSIQQPREELLFRAVELSNSALTTKTAVDKLRADNEKIRELLQVVDERLSAIRVGEQRADKKLLHTRLQAITQLMTDHVDTVQQQILPIARRRLSDSDWEAMQIKIQYLEQEQPTSSAATAPTDEERLSTQHKATVDSVSASESMTVRQLLSPYAMVESSVAWWRGMARLGDITRDALRGEIAALREIRPVVTETAVATLQPYKTRVYGLGNLLTDRLRA